MKAERYPVAYRVDHRPEGWTPEELAEQGLGGADALFIVSIMGEPGHGPYSTMMLGSRDGAMISDVEMFQVFELLASHLSTSEALGRSARDTAQRVLDDARKRRGLDPGRFRG